MSIEQRWDHRNDLAKHEPSLRHQRLAVSRLLGVLHGLIESGYFGTEVEKVVRSSADKVCTEFEMEKMPPRQAVTS